MDNYMDKQKIIDHKQLGLSNREVARRTGIDRKTVSKYWNEYQRRLQHLDEPGADTRELQDSLQATPKYNAANRKRRKYTEELDNRLKAVLKEEERKDRLFGPGHKQKLTNKQIHEKLLGEGFEISGVTINIALAEMRKRQREVFIRQQYELGDRLEYDFGEVFLDCGEGVKTYHMAVLSSPGGEMIFNLISSRNEKGSIIATSNLTFDRWEEVFKDPTLTGALIDRLAHKAHVLDISREKGGRFEETIAWLEDSKR